MKYLTVDELMDLLKLSERQVKALFQVEGFPGVKIGTNYRVEEDMLKQYLATAGEIHLDYNNR